MNELTRDNLKRIIEGAIFAADAPLNEEQLRKLFNPETAPSLQEIKQIIRELVVDYQTGAIELIEVASGFRFQVSGDLTPWIQKLWEEKPVKYSRALLETLALIVYKQPITRAEIEAIRGVAVGSSLIKTLIERNWIRIISYKEVPGKPALYASTKQFLDDFGLQSLTQLPALSDLLDFEQLTMNDPPETMYE